MDRRYIIATIGILVAFSIGLVGFFMVSDGMPDGLDKTLEEYGAGDGEEPVWSAPLDYGSSYLSALLMGTIGFFITLLAMFGLVKLRKAIRMLEKKSD